VTHQVLVKLGSMQLMQKKKKKKESTALLCFIIKEHPSTMQTSWDSNHNQFQFIFELNVR
jgi:hypothetical protein